MARIFCQRRISGGVGCPSCIAAMPVCGFPARKPLVTSSVKFLVRDEYVRKLTERFSGNWHAFGLPKDSLSSVKTRQKADFLAIRKRSIVLPPTDVIGRSGEI